MFNKGNLVKEFKNIMSRQKSLLINFIAAFAILFLFINFSFQSYTIYVQADGNNIQNSVGICRGFGIDPVKTIPVSVIEAASKFLKTHSAIGGLGHATLVDPIRESSKPHRCIGVPSDINPYSLDQKVTDKAYIAELKARQMNYSGVIPPGATKAMRISVLHPIKRPIYTGNDPATLEWIYKTSSSGYANSDLIIAYYPSRGWVGVFKFPAEGGWPAYP